MDLIEGKTFKNKEIFLDFSVWRKCNFVNCTLVAEYGMFKLQKSDVINCKWIFPQNTPAGTIYSILKEGMKGGSKLG